MASVRASAGPGGRRYAWLPVQQPMKLAFVPPRFGPGVLGGSEAVSRRRHWGCAARGHDVEVLTTCALDHYSWANELPEGTRRKTACSCAVSPSSATPAGPPCRPSWPSSPAASPTSTTRSSWLGFQFGAPACSSTCCATAEATTPSSFRPTCSGRRASACPFVAERAVVVPCLHDEHYARLDILRPVSAAPALVWFLSGPEHEPGPPARAGGPAPQRDRCRACPCLRRYDPEGFMERHGLQQPLRAVRRPAEEGKGTAWLLEAFAAAAADGALDLDLVIIGQGERVPCPGGLARAGSSTSGSSATRSGTTPSPRRRPTCSPAGWRASHARSWRRGWRGRPSWPWARARSSPGTAGARAGGVTFSDRAGSGRLACALVGSRPDEPARWPPPAAVT